MKLDHDRETAHPHARADRPPRAWLLNLDAELELRRPLRYQPTKRSLRACEYFEPWASGLVAPGDLVLPRQAATEGMAKGYLGRAWCPTPSALAALRGAGATVEPAPSLECLRLVNHRSFHDGLGQTLPDARCVGTFADAQHVLSAGRAAGWMVKRGFGFAGRSNRRFPIAPSHDDWRWLHHALLDGGVQIEPWLTILVEFSLHGVVSLDGSTALGHPCVLVSHEPPVYARAEAGLLSEAERQALCEHADRVSAALRESGYWGPFGIDAFRYDTGSGPRFNPRSEINARYTLAFATGMGAAAF